MQNRLTVRSYFLFLLLLPFAYSSKIVDPILMPRQLFLSFFVLLLIGMAFYQKLTFAFFTIKNPLYLAIAGYFAFAVAAFIGNPLTAEGHAILSRQLLLFAFLILTTALLYQRKMEHKNLIQSTIVFVGITCGAALLQALFLSKANFWAVIQNFSGLSGNKNLLASAVFLGIPFLLMGLQLSKKVRHISIVLLCIAVLVIALSQTRAVFLGCMVLITVLSGFHIKDRFQIKNRNLLIFGSGIFIVAIAIYKLLLEKAIVGLRPSSKDMVQQYLFRIFNSSTFTSRTQYWKNSVDMFKEHPFLGVGFGNWQVEFPKYGLEKFDGDFANGITTLQRPHNDFLQVLCETGILGLLAYCAIFGVILYQLAYLIGNAENKMTRWKFIYILGGILGYTVISFFDFPLERMEHQILLMLLFAMVTAAYSHQKQTVETTKPEIFRNLIIIIAFYALFISAFRLKGEYETVRMKQAKDDEQWDQMLFFANKAQHHFYQIDASSMPIEWYKGIAYFNRKEIDESILHFEAAYKMAPYQILVIDHLATAYLAKKEKEKATAYYNKALAISPKFEEAKLNLAAIYYNEKNFEKAYSFIETINPNTKNKKYRLYLALILQKEINRILTKNDDAALSRKVAATITSSEIIYNLYVASKKEKVSFETYVLRYGSNLK